VKVAAIYGPRASAADASPFQRCVPANFAREITNNLDAVLVFGGDGTIHRHLPKIAELKIPTLPVPTGSGNDFASGLGIHTPRGALRLWKQFLATRTDTRLIDLGLVTSREPLTASHLFCNVANFGIDADINRRANRLPRFIRANGGYISRSFPNSYAIKLAALHSPASTTIDRAHLPSPQPLSLSPTDLAMDGGCKSLRKRLCPMVSLTSASSDESQSSRS
jgi:hypothetical protein